MLNLEVSLARVDPGERDGLGILEAGDGIDQGDEQEQRAGLAGRAHAGPDGAGGDVEDAAVEAPLIREPVAGVQAEAGVGVGVDILAAQQEPGLGIAEGAALDQGRRRIALEPPEQRLGADGEASGLGRAGRRALGRGDFGDEQQRHDDGDDKTSHTLPLIPGGTAHRE